MDRHTLPLERRGVPFALHRGTMRRAMSAGADPHLVADDARGLGTPPGGWATRIDANTFALPPLRAHAMKRGTPPQRRAAPARRRRRPQLDAKNRGSRVATFLCRVSEATLALPGGGAGEGVATYAYDPATGRLGVNLGFAYDGALLTKSSFAGATSGSINWSYDGFLRAKQEDLGAGHLYPVTYAYDADDLLVTVAAAGTSALTYSRYDEQDRLVSYDGTTYTYTAWGALASSTANGATTTYTYDALGALREVDLPVTADSSGGTWTYTNDALGRRIVRRAPDGTVTKLLYAGMRPAALLDANDAVVARYVYGRDRLAPELIVTAGTTYRVLCDHLGTPRLLVDAAGNVAEQSDYDASGVLVARTGRVSENISASPAASWRTPPALSGLAPGTTIRGQGGGPVKIPPGLAAG
jgi:YD repeat-containing protein